MKEFRYILYRQEPGLARLTLNRPPLDILNLEMMLSAPVLQMAKGAVHAASNRTFGDLASTLKAVQELYLSQPMGPGRPPRRAARFPGETKPLGKHRKNLLQNPWECKAFADAAHGLTSIQVTLRC